jgi:hypothetical protein
MRAKPRLTHLHSIKFLHHDKFLAPRQLLPRHCTSAHLPASCNRDNVPATYKPCTATLVMLNKICAMTAKTRAIPSLHRDNFSTKVPGPCPVLASGNTTSLYCRAVRFHSFQPHRIPIFYEIHLNIYIFGHLSGLLHLKTSA